MVLDESEKMKIKHRKNRIIRKEDDYGSSVYASDWHSKKYILSSVLKALALEVVIVGWLSQSSYIQDLEETMQHIYADQSVHR